MKVNTKSKGENMADESPTPAGKAAPERSVGTSGSVYLIRGLASVMLILTFLLYVILIADTESSNATIGLLLSIVGLALGFVGIWMGNVRFSKKLENMPGNMIFLGISLIFLIAGAVVYGSKINTGSEIALADIVWVLLYGFFMLTYIELSHASLRFTDIDNYTRTHELKGFNVSGVVNNYFIWFGILMGVIITIAFLILATHYGLLIAIKATNEVFGSSVELNSIYIFAISVAIWFIPLGIFAAIIFGEGSLIKSTKTILIKTEKAPGEELVGLQAIEKPEETTKE
jgi:hypothetical protein